MDVSLNDLLTITKKELTHFFRDPHVLIYSLILPLVGYPLLIVGSFEGALWQESLAEKKVVSIAFDNALDMQLYGPISKSPRFQVETFKSSQECIDALQRGDVDAIVRRAINSSKASPAAKNDDRQPAIEVLINSDSSKAALAKERIATIAEDEHIHQVLETLKAAGHPNNFLKVFAVKMRNMAPISELSSYILPAICGFSLIMIGFGAIYPAVCAFPEEREKRTLDSTLMLPVDRFALVLGKNFAVLLVSLMSGFINLCSMLMVFWVISIQPNAQNLIGNLGGGSFFGTFHLAQVLMIVACFVVTSVETAAVFLFLSQASKTFKEAQNILTIPVLVMALIPIALCYPNLELNWNNVWIPLLNLVLTLRSAFSSDSNGNLCLLALAQNLVISASLLIIVGKIVGREEFLQGKVSLVSVLFGKQRHKR